MSTVFNIDPSFIQALNSKEAEELIVRLCRAELRSQNISEVYVTYSGNHIANDGGVDIRLADSELIFKKGFIRAENTIFQVKAESYSPAQIYKEMEPKGKIRDVIVDLKAVNGAYIIVSTKDYITDKPLQKRIQKMRECLKKHNLEQYILVDFYDSGRIANWVETHPSVATWLREKIGKPLKAWKPYGAWAYREEDSTSEYFVDNKARVLTPYSNTNCVDISQAIAQLRGELKQPSSIRLVGLSGVGKTRLVQVLFDPKVCPESACRPAENVIYTDLADDPNPTPQQMLENVQAQNADAVVIVDNCGSETHASLTNIIERKSNRLRLITIEYDIRDDLPESTSCYRLESASPDVIRKILKQRYEILSSNDLDRIVDFSDGNARVALAVADTAKRGGELAQLRDAALFTRLFHQKYQENDELLKCAQAASLLYSFDGENFAEDGELALLASFAEVSVQTFSRYLVELKRRGLLQSRGQWRALLPHAIANNLARHMLEPLTADFFYKRLIEQASERVALSFTRRLSFLHESSQAQELAAYMMGANRKLGDLLKLDKLERQMFNNLAPVHPVKALDLFQKASQDKRFTSLNNLHRLDYISLLRRIAYESEFFETAVLTLSQFALAETTTSYGSSTKHTLASLFQCYLSGTKAEPKLRCQVVKPFLVSAKEAEQELGLSMLRSGLKTHNFQLSFNVEFGARRRDYGWHPSAADRTGWYKSWINLVASIYNDKHLKAALRSIMAEALLRLWGKFGVDEELTKLAYQWHTESSWPEGWASFKRLLVTESTNSSPASLEQLKELVAHLAPTNLVEELYATIFVDSVTATYSLDITSNENETLDLWPDSELYEKLTKATEAIGTKAAKSPEILKRLIPELCSTSNNSVELGYFGKGVGEHYHDVNELLKLIRNHMESVAPAKVSLLWVRGVLAGWKEQSPNDLEIFLDTAATDPVWSKQFGELKVHSKLNQRQFDRLMKALDTGRSLDQIDYLRSEDLAETWSVSQVMELSYKLASIEKLGVQKAILTLYRVITGSKYQSDSYRNELTNALWLFLNDVVWKADELFLPSDHYFKTLIDFAFERSSSNSLNLRNLHSLLAAIKETYFITDIQKTTLRAFFKHLPEMTLRTVCNLENQQAIKRTGQLVASLISEDLDSALIYVPKDILLRWCSEDLQIRCSFAAENCKLFEDNTAPNLLLSDIALSILNLAPDKMIILDILIERFVHFSNKNPKSLELRLCLFDQLRISQDSVLNTLIDEKQHDFYLYIQEEKDREIRENNMRNLSFE